MDLREQLRIQETAKLRQGEAAYHARIAEAEERLAAAREKGDVNEVSSVETALEIAKREAELFIWEHDTTGALKGDRFGSQLRSALEEEFQVSRNENGEAVCGEGDPSEAHVLIVNMGELDRLNASGDHALGDKALDEAFLRVQQSIDRVFASSAPEERPQPDVFRIASNDFGIILKRATPQQVAELTTLLSQPLDVSLFRPGEEPAPLSAASVSLANALETFNHLPKKPETLGPERDTTATDLITVIREKAQSFSDFEKARSRVSRIVDKIGGGDPNALAAAKDLYEKFLKKSLGELFLEDGETAALDFEPFVERIRRRGAFGEDTSAWQAEVFAAARLDALKQLSARLSRDRGTAEVISRFMVDAFEKKARSEQLPETAMSLEAPVSSRPEIAGSEKVRDEAGIRAFEQKMNSLGLTDGEWQLTELEAKIAAAPPEDPHRALDEVLLKLEKAKRDALTGLYGRGMYYTALEARMRENAPTSVIAIDMAFLKYFDRDGGAATGDRAIKAAARIMDAARREILQKHADVFVEAYRTGGDEFAMTVGSGDAAITEDLQRIIKRLTLEVGELPFDEGGSGRYVPTELQFNFGQFVAEHPTQEIAAHGGAFATSREAADSATHFADAGIEPDKAVNRLVFLIQKQLEASRAPEGDPARTEQEAYVKDLTARSEKAIFDGTGSAKIGEWVREIVSRKRTSQEIVRDIVGFVLEEIKKKKSGEITFTNRMHQDLAHNIEVSLLEKEVGELFTQIRDDHARYEDLRSRFAALQQELRDIRSDRSRVGDIKQKIQEFRESV